MCSVKNKLLAYLANNKYFFMLKICSEKQNTFQEENSFQQFPEL